MKVRAPIVPNITSTMIQITMKVAMSLNMNIIVLIIGPKVFVVIRPIIIRTKPNIDKIPDINWTLI